MKTQFSLTHASIAVAASLGLLAGGVFVASNSQAAPQPTVSTHTMNWFGGPAYMGDPALEVTAALVEAGGGADNFSFSTALVSMLGEDTVNAEVAKLSKQYGADQVKQFWMA